MYTIRTYEPKDRKRVEAICLSPEKPDFDGKKGKRSLPAKVMLTAFCDYYVEQEPQNCFVAADERDEAVGYILCAENFPTWEKNFTGLYLKKTHNPVTRALGRGTVEGLRPYAADYPAHLHIDLAGSCQRQGLGTRLMDTLLAHLEAKGVRGVMLSVAAGNEKGIGFYQKYGFRELGRTKQEITMGKILEASV